MDIWLTWCRKKAKCSHCGEMILSSQPIVRGKLWKNKKWPYTFKWHPKCWMDQAMAALEKREFVPLSVGRPKLELSQEDRLGRLKVLRKHATLVYRQKKAARESNIEEVIRLEVMKQELTDEIRVFGGSVPARWEVD